VCALLSQADDVNRRAASVYNTLEARLQHMKTAVDAIAARVEPIVATARVAISTGRAAENRAATALMSQGTLQQEVSQARAVRHRVAVVYCEACTTVR
jgi:hypothetical protein